MNTTKESSHRSVVVLSRKPSAEIALRETGVEPLDGNDNQIYSLQVGSGPFSFIPLKPFQIECPPPTYITLEKLQEAKPIHSHEILSGCEVQINGSLKCIDQEVLDRQKGVVKDVLKQMPKVLTSRLGTVGVVLPIRIFEPRSSIERMIDRFSFCPVFLMQAAQNTDQFERFLNVIAFAVAGLYMATKQEKPFNPLLGETFQGYFGDDTKVFAEHVNHDPPIDTFFIQAVGYIVYGYTELDGSFQFNSLIGSFKGPTNVKFDDGQFIVYNQPKFRLEGMMWGDRNLLWEGELKFEDPINNWVAIINIGSCPTGFNPHKIKVNKDTILGKIYVPKGDRIDKIDRELATLHGSWIKELIVVKEGLERKLWELDRELPVRHLPCKDPLPTDWRYREDIIWLTRNKRDYAQNWKTVLEARQRSDRELRKRSNL